MLSFLVPDLSYWWLGEAGYGENAEHGNDAKLNSKIDQNQKYHKPTHYAAHEKIGSFWERSDFLIDCVPPFSMDIFERDIRGIDKDDSCLD